MKYDLTEGLPIVPMRVGVSAPLRNYLERTMDRVPRDIIVRGLVDTGASKTVIDQTLVSKLCLPDHGYCNVRAFSGALHVDENSTRFLNYGVSFAILSEPPTLDEVVVSEAMQVIGTNMEHPDFEVLIGMDVLRLCTFFMDLSAKYFDISPSMPEQPVP